MNEIKPKMIVFEDKNEVYSYNAETGEILEEGWKDVKSLCRHLESQGFEYEIEERRKSNGN